MVRRLWLVVSALWAAAVLYGGTGRAAGIQPQDVILAVAPLILGQLLAWIVTGSAKPDA